MESIVLNNIHKIAKSSDGRFCLKVQPCLEPHDHILYPNTYYDLNFRKGRIEEEFFDLKFECILYFFFNKKRRVTTRVKLDYDKKYMSGIVATKRATIFPKKCSKNPQRFLEKTWVTVQFGMDVFKYKHPFKKRFSVADLCKHIINGTLLNELEFDSDECIPNFNEQIERFFCSLDPQDFQPIYVR